MRRGALCLLFLMLLLVSTLALAGPVVQLTSDPGTDWDPAWSPDGTEVAFGSDRGDPSDPWGFDVWVVNVETGVERRVSAGLHSTCPAWSPDGSIIASDGVWLMNADGSGSPWFLTGGNQPAWSPDGARLAFSNADDIWVINVGGTGLAPVTDDGSTWFDSHPAWSPDGGEIAFVSDRGGDFAIWAIQPDGTGLRFVHDVDPGGWAAEPAWSPDGQWISFQYLGEVYAVDGNGENLRRITYGGGWDGTWSPDGTRFAFTSDRSGNADIWVGPTCLTFSPANVTYPLDGSVIAETIPTFTWEPLPEADHFCLCLEEAGHSTPPVWSRPDIAGDATSITYNDDGLARDPELSPGSAYRLHLVAWSPGDECTAETVIEFWVGPKPVVVPIQGTIFMSGFDPPNASFMSGDSSSITPAPHSVLWDSGLSRDGQRIVYRASDGLHVCDDDGGNDTALGVSGCKPQWSPDGKRIAFSAPTEDDPTPEGCVGGGEIFVVNADGSGLTQVTSRPGPDRIDDWSPDGRFLLWENCTDWQVWISESDGANAHAITGPGFSLPRGSDTPRWSPDGSRILVNWIDQPVEGQYVACLSTVALDGSDPALLLQWPLPEEVHGHVDGYGWWLDANFPAWSPDGSQIALCSARQVLPAVGTTRDMEVYLLNSDGSGLVRVTYDFANQSHLSWIGPNTQPGLAVSVTVCDATVTFEEVTAAGSTAIIASDPAPAGPPEEVLFLDDRCFHISTTAGISGEVEVEVHYDDAEVPGGLEQHLCLLLWDGSGWVDITIPPIDTVGNIIRGEFIPGAERDWFVVLAWERPPVPNVKVMFEACTEGRPAGPALFVANGDLTDPMRITLPPVLFGGCGEVGAVWSPGGTQVAMTRAESDGRWVLQTLDLEALLEKPGQEAQVLTNETGDPIEGYMPAWSPSGEEIVYGNGDSLFPARLDSVSVVNADGTGAHALYAFPEGYEAAFRYPDWSPDGARIVFGLDRVVRRDGDLYLLENLDDPGGATLRPLTEGTHYHHDAPHWSPDGARIVFTRSPRGAGVFDGGDIWIMDVDTGAETQVTHTPSIPKMATGWCPYDGYIYFTSDLGVERILPDGRDEQVVNADIGPLTWTLERWSWIPTGVWIDGLSALPGEAVSPKMGIADAEALAGVQAKVRYRGGANTLTMDSAELGDSILDWVTVDPLIGAETISVLAYAGDPEHQKVSGPAHLFDLNVTNRADAAPGATQLLSFDKLLLSDEWGEPIERVSFSGGVHTIPFASLEVSTIAGPVGADAIDPLPFPVTVTAHDRNGWTMPDCNATIELNTFDWQSWNESRDMLRPVTPASAELIGGEWSGAVSALNPRPQVWLLAHWEDIGGYSNWFQAIGKGDVNADNKVSIFDVVKTANMAIGRGTWADWQVWAADVNRDHAVNIFDVVICANKALEAMQSLAVGRAAAAAPTGPVTVTTTTTSVGAQTTVTVELSDCAGLAGVQVELAYDGKKLKYAGMTRGGLLKSTWSALDNDLGGTVKAIAYTASGDVLAGGKGAVLGFTFNASGKAAPRVELTSIKLSDAEGGEIPCQIGKGKPGGKPR